MDRRIALKNMGLALGYTVATPTLLSLVQSCKNEDAFAWTPDFFTKEEGAVITQLVDIILPKTDTPSATEVQVNIFIDRFAHEVMEKEQQDFVKLITGKFIGKALKESGKESAAELEADELEPVLAAALKIDKAQQEANQEAVNAYMQATAMGETAALDDTAAIHAFASNLRDMTIWGYKASEYVGENVLAYLPVPGEYIACGDVNDLTGGKDWSL
jgi:hypothetical protein